MREMWATFADDPAAPIFEPVFIGDNKRLAEAIDQMFDVAVKKGELFGRKLNGMWITDPDSEQGAALKAFGTIPVPSTPETTWYGRSGLAPKEKPPPMRPGQL